MITFEIATPERVISKEEIDQVSLPTELGEITILPGHIPLVANLVPGEMKITKDGKEILYMITDGFVEVRDGNAITVLADAAERPEEIDEQAAEEARVRAKKLMKEPKGDAVKEAKAAAVLERSLMRLRIARKKKYRDLRRPPTSPVT